MTDADTVSTKEPIGPVAMVERRWRSNQIASRCRTSAMDEAREQGDSDDTFDTLLARPDHADVHLTNLRDAAELSRAVAEAMRRGAAEHVS